MAATLYDITINEQGRYQLIDADIGQVSDLRFKYICDEIQINRKRLDFMLDHLCDWSDADALEARASLVPDSVLELPEDENIPRK